MWSSSIHSMNVNKTPEAIKEQIRLLDLDIKVFKETPCDGLSKIRVDQYASNTLNGMKTLRNQWSLWKQYHSSSLDAIDKYEKLIGKCEILLAEAMCYIARLGIIKDQETKNRCLLCICSYPGNDCLLKPLKELFELNVENRQLLFGIPVKCYREISPLRAAVVYAKGVNIIIYLRSSGQVICPPIDPVKEPKAAALFIKTEEIFFKPIQLTRIMHSENSIPYPIPKELIVNIAKIYYSLFY